MDTIGLGAGVHDRLKELGYSTADVNVAKRPTTAQKRYREEYVPKFSNLRAQLWWNLRNFCREYGSIAVDNEKFINEITSPKYKLNSSGEVVIEAKEDMRKRGIASPNMADAVCLVLYDQPRFWVM